MAGGYMCSGAEVSRTVVLQTTNTKPMMSSKFTRTNGVSASVIARTLDTSRVQRVFTFKIGWDR